MSLEDDGWTPPEEFIPDFDRLRALVAPVVAMLALPLLLLIAGAQRGVVYVSLPGHAVSVPLVKMQDRVP